MIETLLTWLNGWGLADGRPPLTGGVVSGLYRNSSKVTLILLDDRGRPGAVAKVTRRPSAEASLMAEYAALKEITTAAPDAMLEAPTPLALERLDGHLVLVESPLAGKPMTASYYSPGHTAEPSRVIGDFEAAETWLARFQHLTTTGEVTVDSSSMRACVDVVRERYRQEVGWSDVEDELFTAIECRGLNFEGTALPLVGVHGDFWMGNLLVAGGRVEGVVDWELARLNGLPFRDIFKFPTSYGLYLDRAYPGDGRAVPGHHNWGRDPTGWAEYGDWSNLTGFRYSYFETGWFPELVRDFIVRQLARVGIPSGLVTVFFPLFLAEQAMTLDDPVFREGYRSALAAFWRERNSTWLWDEATSDLNVTTLRRKDS